MRTFEDIKEGSKNNFMRCMQSAKEKLEEGQLKDFEVLANNGVIRDCTNYLDNIDEVATIEIGAVTNSLIRWIQQAYRVHLSEYYDNFERFIDEYILGSTPDGGKSPKANNGFFDCLELGVGRNDLLCFKGRSPFDSEVGDIFRQAVNAKFGTTIPMDGAEQQAYQAYEAARREGDEHAIAQAYMELKEIQRDSGALINGGTYYLLATNQAYQDAKAKCAGKSL